MVLGVAFLLTALHASLEAQTLDWGSEVFSDLVDSEGVTLDENLYVFQLGAFVDGFEPDEENVSDWSAHWRVFDAATYNESLGYFSSTVRMQDDGTSDSSYQTTGSPSFEGLSAYIWIRNSDDPEEGTEWFLARAGSWVFPSATPGCCDNELPVQWSISDLGSGTPVWGSQSGVSGSGSYTVTGPYTLQTYTFVPEPSSLVLAAVSLGLLMRRHRE